MFKRFLQLILLNQLYFYIIFVFEEKVVWVRKIALRVKLKFIYYGGHIIIQDSGNVVLITFNLN
jgi:hypothetical protein